jgi:hypothetical protein
MGDIFYPCGCLRGEHNFCPKHDAGEEKPHKVVWSHSFRRGDQYDPAEEHWISVCGYAANKPEEERHDALIYAATVELLNRESCCPNYTSIYSLGNPPRKNIITDHLRMLIGTRASDEKNTNIRKDDLEWFLRWFDSLDEE